jgi:hypothetical protein
VDQADMTIDDGESGGLMRSEWQQGKMASEGDGGRPGGACCFLGPELRTGSQADVAPGSVTADTSGMGGTGGGARQQGEDVQRQRNGAVGGGSDGIGTGTRFLGSELPVEPRAGVAQPEGAQKHFDAYFARAAAMANGGSDGGSMGSGRQRGEVGHGFLGVQQPASCFPKGPEHRVGSVWISGDGRRHPPVPEDVAASRQRWEARWAAREAREKAASARKRAARDQGNKTGPIRAGPCAACARQGGVCGFCKKRQRLAC